MNTEIMLITKELRRLFKPCIMSDIYSLMGESNIFGYGITEDNNAVGAVVCSYEEDMFRILSLAISPDYRRHGYASQLLDHVAQVCRKNELAEIITRYFMGEAERVPLEALLTRCGYSMTSGDFKQVLFTLGALEGSRVEKQLLKTNAAQTLKKLVTFGELTTQQQRWLLGEVSMQWEERLAISTTRSCVSVRNGQIRGAALISERGGELEIVQLYSAPDDETSSILCLFAAIGEAYQALPRSTVVRFRAVGDIADGLLDKLLADCETSIIHERIAYRTV